MQAEAALSIQPANVTADHCSLPVITIRLDNVTNLTAYTIRLTFEPYYLRVLEVNNGDFLKDEMPAPDNAIDNAAGTVRFGMARFGDDTLPESGSGALVLLRVMALQAGQTVYPTVAFAQGESQQRESGPSISSLAECPVDRARAGHGDRARERPVFTAFSPISRQLIRLNCSYRKCNPLFYYKSC